MALAPLQKISFFWAGGKKDEDCLHKPRSEEFVHKGSLLVEKEPQSQ
jgi:hypothetical protein